MSKQRTAQGGDGTAQPGGFGCLVVRTRGRRPLTNHLDKGDCPVCGKPVLASPAASGTTKVNTAPAGTCPCHGRAAVVAVHRDCYGKPFQPGHPAALAEAD